MQQLIDFDHDVLKYEILPQFKNRLSISLMKDVDLKGNDFERERKKVALNRIQNLKKAIKSRESNLLNKSFKEMILDTHKNLHNLKGEYEWEF